MLQLVEIPSQCKTNGEERNRKKTLEPQAWAQLFFSLSPELKYVGNGSSLPIREGDSLRLLCVVDSNPPATLSWAQGSRILSPSQPWKPGALELLRVESGHEGEFTCRAQHPRGSLHVSLRLLVQSEWGRGKQPERGHQGAGEFGGTADPSPHSPQTPHSCWDPPAPGRTRVCSAAAPPGPSLPPPCAGGWGRGCWRGTTAMPPTWSPPAQPGPGPTAP